DLGKALAQRPHEVMLRKESAVLKSKIASYLDGRKAMGANIFGRGQCAHDDAAAVPPKNRTESQHQGETDNGSGTVGGVAGGTPKRFGEQPEECKGWAGGRYALADGVAPAGFGAGGQGGRRRHVLLLVRV
ncbi:unnamed protein product, partial [Pylaiella littoralis]